MEVKVAVILCLAFFSVAEAVKVSVYYESLCPDSIRFLTEQFHSVYQQLGSSAITVDFLPYGKASHTQNANGQWSFVCQHGPEECRGNKVQACALKYISNPDLQEAYVNCVMANSYPPDAGQSCATSVGGVSDYSAISNCIATAEGDVELVAYGDRTHALGSILTFVPTIIYDNVFNQSEQDESLYNFLGVVCRHLPDPKPSGCP
ncbi:GILT-like protein 1 [Neocloeon triangulifer]|uniref:GILT-like protein 1 n=1 Tax=Neocloeon triangulifer TaxID=2078957 RepID=UPI00286EB51C|nr:GILT-like protein 1 [Neocloeon triangulifer]